MPMCDVCSKTEFALKDGHYVCIECNTVLEDEVEVVQELSQATCSTTIRLSQEVSSQQLGFSGLEYDWSLYDAFNIILCHMTTSLIRCGVSPEARPMVLTLWAAWLSKMGIAFNTPPKPQDFEAEDSEAFDDRIDSPNLTRESPDLDTTTRSEASFSTSRSLRDLPFCYENIIPKKKKRKKKSTQSDMSDFDDTLTEREKKQERKRRLTAYLRTQRADDESLAESSQDPESADESLSESGRSSQSRLSCLENLTDSDSESGENDNPEAETARRSKKLRKKAGYVRKEPEYMTLTKLLSFLHAALILTGEHYSQASIIRWVREGHIPFFGAFKLLPSTMKPTGKTTNILGAAGSVNVVPSSNVIRRNTARLLRMLGFRKITKPPVMPFVFKIVQDLQLPSEILSHVGMLVDQVDALDAPGYIRLGSQIPSIEARAAAFVLMALKLLLGLDDYTEKRISDFAEKVNAALGLKPASEFVSEGYPPSGNPHLPTLFAWKEWTRYINYRKVILEQYHVPTALRHGIVDEMDPDYLTQFCRGRGKLWLYPTSMNREKNHAEICEQTAKLLESFQDSHREAETIEFKPASLPFQGLVKQLFEQDRVKFKGVGQRFPETSLSFLWDPESLVNELEKAGESLDQYPFLHPTERVQLIEMKRNWNEELGRRRSGKPEEPQLFQISQGYLSMNGLEKIYWTLHAHTEIVSDQRWQTLFASFPYSFQWMLTLMAETVEEHPKDIYNQLTVLEDLICFENFNVICSRNTNRVLRTRAKYSEKILANS